MKWVRKHPIFHVRAFQRAVDWLNAWWIQCPMNKVVFVNWEYTRYAQISHVYVEHLHASLTHWRPWIPRKRMKPIWIWIQTSLKYIVNFDLFHPVFQNLFLLEFHCILHRKCEFYSESSMVWSWTLRIKLRMMLSVMISMMWSIYCMKISIY